MKALKFSTFFLVFVSIQSNVDSQSPLTTRKGPQTLCNSETFESECPPNQVVMFERATFQESSSCDDASNSDPNSTGLSNCSLDITTDLEITCLGKWSCSVSLEEHLIKWQEAYRRMECSRKEESLKPSVSLSYECVSVEKSACLSCENSDYAKLTQKRGYLASIVTRDSRISYTCGNSRCPWYFLVPPGQIVNVSIIDSDQHSSSGHHQRHPSSLSSSSSSCQKKYITIKERANPKDFYYCGGRGRLSHLYTSVSNSIEVHVNDEWLSNIGGQFLIYYEVIGCADIIPPRFSRMKRFGDICEIDCPETDIKWTLTCKGQTWEGLEALGECPPAPGLLEAEPQKSNEGGVSIFSSTLFDMPAGVVMALVIACAVILGVLILTTGLVCLKRNQYDAKHRDDPNVYGAACSEFEFREMGAGLVHPALLPKSAPYMNTGAFAPNRSRRASADLLVGAPRDNTYAMQDLVKMDARPLPSLPNNAPHPQAQSNSWRRNDGPVPYGVVRFYPPGVNQPNRVTVQLHRTDSGLMEYPVGATYRARCPPPGGQYAPRFGGPPGTGARFDLRATGARRVPGPHAPGAYDDSSEENHYFVLDGKACAEDAEQMEQLSDQQTMMMTMSATPFPQPPPAHQNKPPVTTLPRSALPVGNGMMMMANHQHQHSFGGGDLRCTCDDRPPACFPPSRPDVGKGCAN